MLQKILVTGASGFLGSTLQNYNDKPDGYEYIYLSVENGDLRQKEVCDAIIGKVQPHLLIHLAANAGGMFKNRSHKLDMLEDNVRIDMNVLRSAHENNVDNVICVLSMCAFPVDCTIPITEDQIFLGTPHTSNEGYAHAKRTLAMLTKFYRETYNRRYVCLTPTNIYGPHDHFDLSRANVIPSLIQRAWRGAALGMLQCKGTGRARRQFLFADDFIKILCWAIDNMDKFTHMLCAPPIKDEVSIRDIALIITKQVGIDVVIFEDKEENDGQLLRTASNEQLLALIPGFEFTSIEDGIQKTVDAFAVNRISSELNDLLG